MVSEMRCAYCFKEITWSEWLFRGHINARCEKVEEKTLPTKGEKIKKSKNNISLEDIKEVEEE